MLIAPLVPHPDTPPAAVDRVTAHVTTDKQGAIEVEYYVYGAQTLLVPAFASPVRADELWKTTCFELFFMPAGGEAYLEFNFSPSTQWAAYVFDGYRAGMRNAEALDPEITVAPHDGSIFSLLAEPWPPELVKGPGMIALSAVIEETDGTKSYWALAHPPGKPDFHHPDCFVLELPVA